METVNQPTQTKSMNVANNLDSSTIKDSPQSIDNVESQDSSDINTCVIKKNNHAQCKTTTAQNETETTNIQLPVVDKVDNNNDNEEEPMDTSSADGDIDKRRKIIKDAQQVEVSVEPQSLPQLYNVEDKEHNYVTANEDGGEKTANEAEKCKYEEDELLKSDNEDGRNAGLKENVTTDSDSISMEQEEELLKSEDEEETISKEKETIFKMTASDHGDTNENCKIKEQQTSDTFQITTQDVEQITENINKTNFKINSEVKLENSNSERHDLKEHNEIKSCDKSFHQTEDYKHKTRNMVEEYCSNDNQSSEREFLTKTRKNSENHRILYQFDLDDDSSSQDSFQLNKSPSAQEIDNKKSNTSDDSSTSQTQAYETVTCPTLGDFDDMKDANKDCREEYNEEDSDNKAENKAEIPYSPSSKVPLSDSDNETDTPYSFSNCVISGKDEEDYGDNEVKQNKNPSPKAASLNSKGSSSDEDDYMHQDVDDVADTKECLSRLSDSSNLTADNLHIINENDIYDEKYQNKTLIKDRLSVNKEMLLNDRNSNDVNNKRDRFLPIYHNGNVDSENDYYETENCNDSFLRHDEESKLSRSRRTSLDTNCMLSSPQQQSSFNLTQNEKSQSCIHKEVNDNDNKKEVESDNESNLKINENSQEDHNSEYNEITDTNKKRFSLSPPLEIRKEEDEASRSSLASSSSYSSSTSSSQHLVIDHPMEDVKEEKVKPLRINLKRKLSYLSDDEDFMGPQQKQVHLHDETLEQESHHKQFLLHEENKEKTPEISDEQRQLEEDIEMAENAVQNYQDNKIENSLILENNKEKAPLFSTGSDLAESSFFKSLLLQQLEKPLATPNMVTNCNVSPFAPTPTTYAPTLTAPPLPTKSEVSSLIQAIPTPPTPPKETDMSATKYLCFKCKTGSFDTLAELTEHQATCLISHNLFPFISSQPPPTTIIPPTNSLTNSLPPSQPATLTEFEETVTHPKPPGVPTIKKRYYKCSSCNTFHENWNLFLHIREQHNRHMCLYCVRFFPTAEKLALHLEIKHDLEQNHFNSEEALRNSIPVLEGYPLESRFLMCCTCQHIFMENEQFSQHDCSEFIKPCSLCGQKGRHTNQCKAHPDSKRFSKLKKKKEKHTQQSGPLPLTSCISERSQQDVTVSPIAITNQNYPPTIISNSNLNCDSGRVVKHQQPQIFNSMHSDDSNSSNNMVIDESCNIRHMPPAQTQPEDNMNNNENFGLQAQKAFVRIEPDLPPDRRPIEEELKTLPALKLVVPKFKLRVPKEFQKSVDDALSTTSDSGEDIDDDQDDEQEKKNCNDTEVDTAHIVNVTPETCIAKDFAVESAQNSLLAESTPANSQDMEVERNSATEAGNLEDNNIDKSVSNNRKSLNSALLLDDDDSLDEPNSNLVRIMQEIERTKLDIQRTKKTSIRHNKQFALPRQPTVSQSSNRTADHNWSPTPPASPNSRWFTPRRSTISQSSEEQLKKTSQNQQLLLMPPSPLKQSIITKVRRDTIGSDMMDIDETITSQPTQTIYCNKLRPLDNENLNISSESIDDKYCNEQTKDIQATDNETSVSDVNTSLLENENGNKQPSSLLIDSSCLGYGKNENNLEIDDTPEKQNSTETPDNMDISLTQSTDNENNQQTDTRQCQEDEADDDTEIDVCDKEREERIQLSDSEKLLEVEKLPPADGIEVANDETVTVDMKLDRPLDKYEIIDFVRVCLKAVYPLCLYCNHARRIAVNGKSLVLHMIGHHRFTATVDSITAEELLPATIVAKLKSFLVELEEHFLNSNSYCTYGAGVFVNHLNERIFECFQCRFVTSTHKELYLHNRKMHLRTAILCFMCRSNFFSFSEILCHICPGVPNKVSVFDVKFRCCLCNLDNIPSPFRLMVHLRKKHFACDVCLEDCRDQSKLSSHVWKHKLHHLCYRCGIAYRNKLDITKHLFWKHGTESTICKRCLQKKWRHVYHFCIPPITFVCEVCNLCFSKAMYLRVHKRLHSGDLRYPCIEDNCEEKFISRKLLLKHVVVHQVSPSEALQENVKDPGILENKGNDLTVTDDAIEGNLKKQSDLQNIKKELIEIKKEPLDDSEMESQARTTQKSSELAEKKEPEEEQVKSSGVKSFTDEKTKEKKHLGRKRKKSKRSKELLEDLNLTAPNLSESDSSDDSDTDSDSKTKSEIDALPRVMLSPPSETENEDKENKSSELVEPGQVLEIWKNFLNTQQDSSTVKELERLKATKEDNKQPKHIPIHVACSDHDYCKIEEPENQNTFPAPEQVKAPKDDFKKPMAEATSTPEISPIKKKQSKSPRRLSSRRSNASSSSSGSSSSSDSSCSCGSNCSCSSSESNSSSSSSSSEDSDSSLASNNSIRKRHRKKSERDRMRKRSESMSPLKQHNLSISISEVIDVGDEDIAKESDNIHEKPLSPKEPLISESDLETNESETDEEFYDEHPQKLANELLAQKRAQLMAQTRLSPSHNYDIVENSRPSTPSLPEEVATNEKPKIKVKKKKRDRKSSCKGLHTNHVVTPEQVIAPAQSVLEIHQPSNSMLQLALKQPSPNAAFINSVIDSHHTKASDLYPMPHNNISQSAYALPLPAVLTEQSTLTPRPLTMPPYGNLHRISEGSSCSDADGSLKRSKRQRRPNKFYGYTSDDENLINGPPLMIGTRAFKPQPPPQLTWRKEDLPTPSKSILHSKNKTPRTPKTSGTFGIPYTSTLSGPSSKKKSRLSLTGGEKSARKRPAKKRDDKMENKFPPIPTLKIRPSEIGLNTTINHDITKSSSYNTTDDTSSDDDTSKEHFSASNSFNSPVVSQTVAAIAPPIVLPSQPPAPPTPQTKAFNHRIPPALLPNPDFATLQYFKANNIRYPIRPPAGARQPREGESVYCYCRCPYDEVSEMIACDGENCLIEWFHFECVGIMVAPQGKWFCAECRPKYSEELYPSSAAGQLNNI